MSLRLEESQMKTVPALLLLLASALLLQTSCATFAGNEGELPLPAGSADVRPGDRVELLIWNEEEMSDTFTVAETGVVVLPKLGAVSIQGETAVYLQETVRQQYLEYLRNPSIQITVLRRVGVSGAVREPGMFLVDLTATLPDVLARAGGLLETGNPNDITVLRGNQRIRYRTSEPHRFVVAELHSGDQVLVGHKSFIARNPMAVITTAVPLVGYLVTVIIPAIRDL